MSVFHRGDDIRYCRPKKYENPRNVKDELMGLPAWNENTKRFFKHAYERAYRDFAFLPGQKPLLYPNRRSYAKRMPSTSRPSNSRKPERKEKETKIPKERAEGCFVIVHIERSIFDPRFPNSVHFVPLRHKTDQIYDKHRWNLRVSG